MQRDVWAYYARIWHEVSNVNGVFDDWCRSHTRKRSNYWRKNSVGQAFPFQLPQFSSASYFQCVAQSNSYKPADKCIRSILPFVFFFKRTWKKKPWKRLTGILHILRHIRYIPCSMCTLIAWSLTRCVCWCWQVVHKCAAQIWFKMQPIFGLNQPLQQHSIIFSHVLRWPFGPLQL